MTVQSIMMDLSRHKFSFFCSRRPSRPIPRTPRFHRYCALLGRDVDVPYRNLPTELWENILKHLPSGDLKSLSLVNKHVGVFARDQLGRRLRSMKASGAAFRSFFASHSPLGVPSYTLKIRSLTLRLSPHSQYEVCSSNDILKYWVRVSRYLNHLEELVFLGTDVRYSGRRNLLGALPRTVRLRRFFCEDDRLLRDSVNSLRNHKETLVDFGGFFDTETVRPRMTADTFLYRFYNVRTLEVGREFLVGLRNTGSVVNLSVRLEWKKMLLCVRSLSTAFRNQLRALRLERKGVVDGYRILDDANSKRWPEWPESPLFLCGYLDIPSLRYLEVRDTAPPSPPEGQVVLPPSAWALGHPGWAHFSDYDGVPNLERLAWRPTWAVEGAFRRTCADAFVRVAGDVLPVLTVWMSLQEHTSGIWDTWTRIDEDFPLERKCIWDAVKEDSWKRMA